MKNKHKKIIISIAVISIMIVFSVIAYYINNSNIYNRLLNSANQSINNENYDKAITLYDEAKKYKNDNSIDDKIALCGRLKMSKQNYNNAIKMMKSKNYLEAIDSFKKVDQKDDKRYSTAQNNINECKKLYISDNLNSAEDNLKNNKYNEANKYLDNIFKMDAKNADALKVKADIVKAIQKQKNGEITKANSSYSSGKLSKDDVLKILNSKIERTDKKSCAIVSFCLSNSSKIINGSEYYEAQLLWRNPGSIVGDWHQIPEGPDNNVLTRYINVNNGKVYKLSNNNLISSEEIIKVGY
jgi:hypothetical protein